MNSVFIRYLLVGGAMLTASAAAVFAKPDNKLAEQRPPLALEQAIPQTFGDWHIDPAMVPLQVSPDVQATLDKIYSQTLTRTYVNSGNQRVMLSIAYGGDQGRATQVHKPEVCYPMQGFQLVSLVKGAVNTALGEIPIMHLVATRGARVEPITYWITVGDTVVRGTVEQNLARLKYGLTGTVPDGILVRVSTISRDEQASYQLQQAFISAMLQGMKPEYAARLIGKLGT